MITPLSVALVFTSAIQVKFFGRTLSLALVHLNPIPGQVRRSHDEECYFSSVHASYDVLRRDVFWLFVEFSVLKWLVRPRVKAF